MFLIRGAPPYINRTLRQSVEHSFSWRHVNNSYIFALCTGFQSMLESNTNFVLFVLVLSLLLLQSIFPIYSRFKTFPGNSDLLQTNVYCAFHLSTLSHTVNALSLTPLQHSSNTLPKDIRFSQSVSSFRSALKTHIFST